jgi:hypothetical protein
MQVSKGKRELRMRDITRQLRTDGISWAKWGAALDLDEGEKRCSL